MTEKKIVTKILVTVTHFKPLPDLVDLVAGRAYTIDGVSDATGELVQDQPAAAENATPDFVLLIATGQSINGFPTYTIIPSVT
jgi:hypothetical protein